MPKKKKVDTSKMIQEIVSEIEFLAEDGSTNLKTLILV